MVCLIFWVCYGLFNLCVCVFVEGGLRGLGVRELGVY